MTPLRLPLTSLAKLCQATQAIWPILQVANLMTSVHGQTKLHIQMTLKLVLSKHWLPDHITALTAYSRSSRLNIAKIYLTVESTFSKWQGLYSNFFSCIYYQIKVGLNLPSCLWQPSLFYVTSLIFKSLRDQQVVQLCDVIVKVYEEVH